MNNKNVFYTGIMASSLIFLYRQFSAAEPLNPSMHEISPRNRVERKVEATPVNYSNHANSASQNNGLRKSLDNILAEYGHGLSESQIGSIAFRHILKGDFSEAKRIADSYLENDWYRISISNYEWFVNRFLRAIDAYQSADNIKDKGRNAVEIIDCLIYKKDINNPRMPELLESVSNWMKNDPNGFWVTSITQFYELRDSDSHLTLDYLMDINSNFLELYKMRTRQWLDGTYDSKIEIDYNAKEGLKLQSAIGDMTHNIPKLFGVIELLKKDGLYYKTDFAEPIFKLYDSIDYYFNLVSDYYWQDLYKENNYDMSHGIFTEIELCSMISGLLRLGSLAEEIRPGIMNPFFSRLESLLSMESTAKLPPGKSILMQSITFMIQIGDYKLAEKYLFPLANKKI